MDGIGNDLHARPNEISHFFEGLHHHSKIFALVQSALDLIPFGAFELVIDPGLNQPGPFF
jgi:hypothetical protein